LAARLAGTRTRKVEGRGGVRNLDSEGSDGPVGPPPRAVALYARLEKLAGPPLEGPPGSAAHDEENDVEEDDVEKDNDEEDDDDDED
jgi:hypothetical protein